MIDIGQQVSRSRVIDQLHSIFSSKKSFCRTKIDVRRNAVTKLTAVVARHYDVEMSIAIHVADGSIVGCSIRQFLPVIWFEPVLATPIDIRIDLVTERLRVPKITQY